jgi:hypothetical protein
MTKQTTLVDHERMIANIVACYKTADDDQRAGGMAWYSKAQCAAYDIAAKYDIAVYLVVAVIAALSPNNKWSRNVINADALIGAFMRGDGIDSL